MCYLNDNLLRTKGKIYFESYGSTKPNNFSQGVISRSSLHDFEYFSLWDNISLDAMHDFQKEFVCIN